MASSSSRSSRGSIAICADEPVSAGGNGQRTEPVRILLAGLGACTSMTIRLYADRKKLPARTRVGRAAP